ncbi:uncharacterized protein TM35_000541170 [Trypanosoma theileri]|uniref:Uncharacterized protein n=1 Tax=Trypanosoma theileri TaxID=67003 RepID=A0A1X0NHE0_9TRYP|nr:uncharacterized protein TM35_000541170 [Trypanosoma theileri]ORC83893.1 hypothetical protein TM35_000541170 [Trypanosoma theileri]
MLDCIALHTPCTHRRAAAILQQQRSEQTAGGREAARQKLERLGGAYGELSRGAPLALWHVHHSHHDKKRQTPLQENKKGKEKIEEKEKGRECTPERSGSHAQHEELVLPSPKRKGLCGCRSPLPKKKFAEKSDVCTAAAAALGKVSPIPEDFSTASLSQTLPLTPDQLTSSSLLSPAELSAVELLAHDIEGVSPRCWQLSQEQLSPSAIYAEDDRKLHAAAAAATEAATAGIRSLGRKTFSSASARQKRARSALDAAVHSEIDDRTARCLHFDAEESVKPQRPSVSGMVLRRYNELTQQRMATQFLVLPY